MCGADDCPRCYPLLNRKQAAVTESHREQAIEQAVETLMDYGQYPAKGRKQLDLYDILTEERDASYMAELYLAAMAEQHDFSKTRFSRSHQLRTERSEKVSKADEVVVPRFALETVMKIINGKGIYGAGIDALNTALAATPSPVPASSGITVEQIDKLRYEIIHWACYYETKGERAGAISDIEKLCALARRAVSAQGEPVKYMDQDGDVVNPEYWRDADDTTKEWYCTPLYAARK